MSFDVVADSMNRIRIDELNGKTRFLGVQINRLGVM